MSSHAPMPAAERLAEPMRSRWSPSVFDARHRLTADQLGDVIEAARWAPSWGNIQPWAFLVLERDGAGHDVLLDHLSRGNRSWVPQASAVVLAAAKVAADPDDATDKGVKGEAESCYDLGQAAAHLTLQATALGLAVHQFGGFDKDAVATALGVPSHYRLLTGIALGRHGDPDRADDDTAAREQRERRRRPAETFVHAGAWGRAWSPATTGSTR
ncbi:nitroreductase family protein [Nocardioides ferulae]|uniref:nitroreductase family protein n=1 Tax=Nocardioides ferulae TaxID=2340821 RepID=UPI000EB45EE4|nr:nitroreductase family protein [Nocardioides ferulae]